MTIIVNSAEQQQFHPVRRMPRDERMNLNLVAMIDVVFLLLMYFLLATNFSQGEEQFRISLPASLSAPVPAESLDLPDEPVVISVSSVGVGLSEYRITIDLGDAEIDSFEGLYRRLREWKAGPGNSTGILFTDTPLIIRPSADCRWDHAVDALNACLRAGYENVRFIQPGG